MSADTTPHSQSLRNLAKDFIEIAPVCDPAHRERILWNLLAIARLEGATAESRQVTSELRTVLAGL